MTNVPAGKAQLTVTVTGIFHLLDTWNNSREIWPKQPESLTFSVGGGMLHMRDHLGRKGVCGYSWELRALTILRRQSRHAIQSIPRFSTRPLSLIHTHSARIQGPVVACMYIHDIQGIFILNYQVIQSFRPPSTSGHPQSFHGPTGSITACQMT